MPPKKPPVPAKMTASSKSKEVALKSMLDSIRNKLGKSSAIRISEDSSALAQIQEYQPTDLDALDHYVIGPGGYASGRMVEIFGEEGCGKTSLLYQGLGANQRRGGISVLADPEFSFDEDRARVLGVNVEELIMLQARTLEEVLETLKVVLQSHNPKNGPLQIGWDSIASTKTKAGIAAAVGDKTPGEVARLFSEQLPTIVPLLHEHRATLIALNQVRTKFGVMFGNNVTTPGGNAVKFYASTRLQFFGGKAIKNSRNEHTGKIVTVMAVKNRLTPPFRKARIRFDYATGYNNAWSTLEHAKRMKLIKPRGEGFSGKGVEGQEAYAEAIKALEWPMGVGPVGALDDAGVQDAGGEEEGDDSDEDGEE